MFATAPAVVPKSKYGLPRVGFSMIDGTHRDRGDSAARWAATNASGEPDGRQSSSSVRTTSACRRAAAQKPYDLIAESQRLKIVGSTTSASSAVSAHEKW